MDVTVISFRHVALITEGCGRQVHSVKVCILEAGRGRAEVWHCTPHLKHKKLTYTPKMEQALKQCFSGSDAVRANTVQLYCAERLCSPQAPRVYFNTAAANIGAYKSLLCGKVTHRCGSMDHLRKVKQRRQTSLLPQREHV